MTESTRIPPPPTGADPEALMEGKPVSIETHFSWLRTRLSVERTLMSWVRTAIALIGFGFTIAKFLNQVSHNPSVAPARYDDTPRLFGLTLVAVGTVALTLACVEYRQMIHYLRSDQFRVLRGVPGMPHFTPLLTVALLLIFIGMITFVSLLLRTAG